MTISSLTLQAREDGLRTFKANLARERTALAACEARGFEQTAKAIRFEIANLEKTIAAMEAANEFCDACQQHKPCSCDDMEADRAR